MKLTLELATIGFVSHPDEADYNYQEIVSDETLRIEKLYDINDEIFQNDNEVSPEYPKDLFS
ncbi:MAG: hypothetical protein EHM58_08995 [Ignavibacteriae bacterium]|nr:MAG: hypothetical protein EHM58_08995 [Ignavibacteriota bacterium]